MKILIPNITSNAWKWIILGYESAFNQIGVETQRYDHLTNQEADYLFLLDYSLNDKLDLTKFKKVFLFVTFNQIREPYMSHENYVSNASRDIKLIEKINNMDNVVKWSFCNTEFCSSNFKDWGDVKYIPLAFDSINYSKVEEVDKIDVFDVVFIGGRANNGYDTKIKIMFDIFKKFMKDGSLRCGFFVGQNISHEREVSLIKNAKVCLNIHDDYQREMGFDLNERNFKVLGLNGNLVSDYVEEGTRLLGEFYVPGEQLLDEVKKRLNMSDEEKQNNIDNIMQNHTYLNRVKQMLEFV